MLFMLLSSFYFFFSGKTSYFAKKNIKNKYINQLNILQNIKPGQRRIKKNIIKKQFIDKKDIKKELVKKKS